MDAMAEATARLFRRKGGTARPEGDQIRAVWAWLDELRVAYPDRPAVEGAYRATEWAVGLSNTPPLTGIAYLRPDMIIEAAFAREGENPILKRATTNLIAREAAEAAEAAKAHESGDRRAYAAGVVAILTWWNGTANLVEFLIPELQPLPHRIAA